MGVTTMQQFVASSSTQTFFGHIRKISDRYGFIRADAAHGAGDYFFLPMTVEPKGTPWAAMEEGARVQFRPTEHEKGLRAESVRVVQ